MTATGARSRDPWSHGRDGWQTMTIGLYNAPMMTDTPHVLVVDDDLRLRELLQKYLAENGFRVTPASAPAHAPAQLDDPASHLIVPDVMLPGESVLSRPEVLVLPILTITGALFAYIQRMARANVIEVMQATTSARPYSRGCPCTGW